MTTYKEIFGKQIKQLSTDPTDAGAEGQVWFNTTSGTFKSLLSVGAWSSGSAMIRATTTAGANHALGVGIQTAAIYAGGYSPYTNKTEHYNGSGWSSGGNMNLTRITSGFGTSTAAVAAGGITFPGTVGNQTEEYNGTAWTTGNALGTSRAYGTGSGILTAGLFFGGSTDGGDTNTVGNTEEYNGTSWSEQNDLNSARKMLGAAGKGPQTAALAFGGDIAPITGNTEAYDGTSWTEVNNLNTARENLGGAGDQTSALAFGGGPSGATATENWDGSSWSTSPATLANGRQSQPTIGTSTSALMVGGPNPSFPGGWVEEYNFSTTVTTGAAWASGGNINTSRYGLRGTGTQTAMVAAGGNIPPNSNTAATEEYNGSSWTSVTSLPAVIQDGNMTGTETASIYAGGVINPGSYPGNTNAYNGSSWTSGGNMNTDVAQYGLTGTSTAAVAFGGYISASPGRSGDVQNYNGTSWSSNPTSLPALRGQFRTAGTQTATFMAGGNAPPGPQPVTTLSYDGSSFSAEADSIVGMNDCGAWGTANSAYFMGGDQPTGTGGTGPTNSGNFYYNGTSWATSARITSGAATFAWAKSSNQNGLIAGGTPGHGNRTEEFQPETTAVNVKTLTSS